MTRVVIKLLFLLVFVRAYSKRNENSVSDQKCPISCECALPYEVKCLFQSLREAPKTIPRTKLLDLSYNVITEGNYQASAEPHHFRKNPLKLTLSCFYNKKLIPTLLNKRHCSVSRTLGKQLPTLQILKLRSNKLTEIDNGHFAGVNQLKTLILSMNNITKVHRNAFEGLYKLQSLQLDHNGISKLHPLTFRGLVHLKVLNLEANKIKYVHPDLFITLSLGRIIQYSSIRNIHLNKNSIQRLAPDTFKHSHNLRLLLLGDNPWDCSCNGQWLSEFIARSTAIFCPTKLSSPRRKSKACVQCSPSSDSRIKNLPLFQMTRQAFSCSPPEFAVPFGPRIIPKKIVSLMVDGSLRLDCYQNSISTSQEIMETEAQPFQSVTIKPKSIESLSCRLPDRFKKFDSIVPVDQVFGSYDISWFIAPERPEVMEVNLTITDTQFHEADSRGDLNYLTVNPKEEQVVTTEGKTSKLVCKIAGYPAASIYFIHPNGTKFTVGKNGRYDVSENGRMEIEDVALKDQGWWHCTAETDYQYKIAPIHLSVLRRRPSLVRKTPVREGETHTIFCHSSEESSKIDLGKPEGVTFWDLPRKNNLDRWNHSVDRYFYNTTDSTLTIVGVKRKDRGLYRCITFNKYGLRETVHQLKVRSKTGTPLVSRKKSPQPKSPKQKPFEMRPEISLECLDSLTPDCSPFVPSIESPTPSESSFSSDSSSDTLESSYSSSLDADKIKRRTDTPIRSPLEDPDFIEDEDSINLSLSEPGLDHDLPEKKSSLPTYLNDLDEVSLSLSPIFSEMGLVPELTMVENDTMPTEEPIEKFITPPFELDCPDVTPPTLKLVEKFQMMHELVHEGMNGPPVAINKQSVIALSGLEPILISCPIAAADYFLWQLPDNSQKQTESSELFLWPEELPELPVTIRCSGASNMGVVDASITLTDGEGKPKIFYPIEQKLMAMGGRMLILPCRAYGNPKPTITWMLPNYVSLSHGQDTDNVRVDREGNLIIENVFAHDGGTYRCTAATHKGYDNVFIELEVKMSTPIIHSPSIESYTVELGTSISLECKATAFPEPEITWYLPSGAIIPMGRGNGRINVSTDGTLEISTFEDVDYGDYTCSARNIGGESSRKVTLSPEMAL